MAWNKITKYSAKFKINEGNIYYVSWNDVGQYCLYYNKTYITSGTKAEYNAAFKKRLKVTIDIVSNSC